MTNRPDRPRARRAGANGKRGDGPKPTAAQHDVRRPAAFRGSDALAYLFAASNSRRSRAINASRRS